MYTTSIQITIYPPYLCIFGLLYYIKTLTQGQHKTPTPLWYHLDFIYILYNVLTTLRYTCYLLVLDQSMNNTTQKHVKLPLYISYEKKTDNGVTSTPKHVSYKIITNKIFI
jgi:hypothetical protein